MAEQQRESHIDKRWKAAREWAKQTIERLEDVLKDHDITSAEVEERVSEIYEKALIQGEKRGINAAIEFLKVHIQVLRARLANGMANHVHQAMHGLATWAKESPNFITMREQQELRKAAEEPREHGEEG